ncbi:MAG: hypothetical protein JRI96_14475 [Deltaproteobacteria bacterium]|nr:hypothetical protein [Deltaproteobacteria bacterium]
MITYMKKKGRIALGGILTVMALALVGMLMVPEMGKNLGVAMAVPPGGVVTSPYDDYRLISDYEPEEEEEAGEEEEDDDEGGYSGGGGATGSWE